MIFNSKSFKLAAVLFVLYSVIAAGIGLLIFVVTDLGSAATTIEQRDANGAVVSRTFEEKDSIPVMVVFTALASGGWLLIPLKFAWDELAKESDSDRRELASREDDRRQTATIMRELVFENIRHHFGPMLYRQRAVAGWAERCREQTGKGIAAKTRLLYSIATLNECYDRLATEGMPILLRSVRAEEGATRCNADLQGCLFSFCASKDDIDIADELVYTVRSGASEGEPLVSFRLFKERVNAPEGQWSRLQEIHAAFVSSCEDNGKLNELMGCADAAHRSLAAGLTEVYREWYGEMPEAENQPTDVEESPESPRKNGE